MKITVEDPESKNKALALLNDAARMVEKAKTVQELKGLRDKAEAVRQYAKQAGESLKIQNHCAEIKLRAERKAGELLKEMPKQAGARGKGKKVEFHDGTPLADLGIDKKESHRWQREASVPDSKFETWIAEQNAAGEEVTQAGLLRIVKDRKKKEKVAAIKARAAKEGAESSSDSDVVADLSKVAGKFRCVYFDPPWAYDDESVRGAAADHYPTMTLEQLVKEFSKTIPALANKEDGCHFWMWTTAPKNRDKVPHDFLDACGLRWVGEIFWNKVNFAGGRWLRSQVEILVLAVPKKGPNLPLLRADQGTYFEEARSMKNSQKPDSVAAMIETLSPGPRIELFARSARKGWFRHGHEA